MGREPWGRPHPGGKERKGQNSRRLVRWGETRVCRVWEVTWGDWILFSKEEEAIEVEEG